MPKEIKYKYLRAWGWMSYLYHKQLFIALMKAGLCETLLRQISIKKKLFLPYLTDICLLKENIVPQI